jgi:hypothetical protein
MKRTLKIEPTWRICLRALASAGRWICSEVEESLRKKSRGSDAYHIDVAATGIADVERRLSTLQQRAEELIETCDELTGAAERAEKAMNRISRDDIGACLDQGGFMPWERGGSGNDGSGHA